MIPEGDVSSTFHTRNASAGQFNFFNFSDPQLDSKLNAMVQAKDDAMRIGMAREVHQRIHELQPIMFLFNNPACIIWNKRLKGVKAHILGIRQWDFYVVS